MLYEMAVGDAFGACFEYAPPEFIAKHGDPLTGYVRHPTHTDLRPGRYTDDTQMAIAVSEVLLSNKPLTALAVADSFVDVFRRDPRVGYARRFQELLATRIHDGMDFLAEVVPDSNKSGGAMRAGPCGLLPSTQSCIDFAMFQASLTHATQEGMAAAAASALMVHWCWYDLGPKVSLPSFLEARLPGFGWTSPHDGPVGSSGLVAVKAALTALVTGGTSLTSILRRAVAFTGDVDTVAAIALCAGSVCKEVEQGLPAILTSHLEEGRYGAAYLQALDLSLTEAFPRERKRPNGVLFIL